MVVYRASHAVLFSPTITHDLDSAADEYADVPRPQLL